MENGKSIFGFRDQLYILMGGVFRKMENIFSIFPFLASIFPKTGVCFRETRRPKRKTEKKKLCMKTNICVITVIDSDLMSLQHHEHVFSLCHGLHLLHSKCLQIRWFGEAVAANRSKFGHFFNNSPFIESGGLRISTSWWSTGEVKSTFKRYWSLE